MKVKKQIRKIVEKIILAIFIVLGMTSVIWLITLLCAKAVGYNLSKAVCTVNDEKIELNIKHTKVLNDFDYEVTLDNNEKWIVNENHCQLIKKEKKL